MNQDPVDLWLIKHFSDLRDLARQAATIDTVALECANEDELRKWINRWREDARKALGGQP